MKLDIFSIQSITLFENVTGAKVKDCFDDEGVFVFVVEEGSIKKAVASLRKVEGLIKKRVRIIGFSTDPAKFINNLIYPLKVEEINKEGDKIVIKCPDSKIKGRIFGRDRENLKKIEGLMKKYYNINEVIIQ